MSTEQRAVKGTDNALIGVQGGWRLASERNENASIVSMYQRSPDSPVEQAQASK